VLALVMDFFLLPTLLLKIDGKPDMLAGPLHQEHDKKAVGS